MHHDELDESLLDAPLPGSPARPGPARRADPDDLVHAAGFTLEPFHPDDAADAPVARRRTPSSRASSSRHVAPVSVADVVRTRPSVVVVERRNRDDSGLYLTMALGAGCSFLALAVLVWSWFS